jgi:mono/diheme cytochrome c family protein
MALLMRHLRLHHGSNPCHPFHPTNSFAMPTQNLTQLKFWACTFLTICLVACGGGGDSGDDDEGSGTSFATSTNAATNAANGQSLYTGYCASCHGASYGSAKNYAQTLSAIARNKGGMGYLSANIQTDQANDIATYLTYGASASTALNSQAISFSSPGDQALSTGTINVTASANSGLLVAISTSTPTVCSISGNSLAFLGVGTCTLTASQSGNNSYAAASPVSHSFAVTAAIGATQTLTFSSPGNQMMESTAPALTASASSGLAVSFASATPSVCAVTGSTLTLRLPGTCTIAANQAGDATYAAAATVSHSFYVIATNAASGKLAYNQVINGRSCATCHGAPGSQPTSSVLSAANADLVLNRAILNNVGGMGVLSGAYSAQQILDIAAYLATPGI